MIKYPRIFYGWWVVVACFFIALYVGGAAIYSFTVIFEPIVNEFGWSYTQVSVAAALRGTEISLLAPIFGILVDRWGPRRLIFAGVVITGVGLILLSYITSLGTFYGAFIILAIGMGTCTNAVLIPAIVNWFHGRAGVAIGIMLCGWGLSGLLVPVVVELINQLGWRGTMFALGVSIWIICLPLSLLVRREPRQHGCLPNAGANHTAIDGGPTQAQASEVNIGAKQALKSRMFWHIVLSQMAQGMIFVAVITHVMPYLSNIGIARVTSGLVAGAIPLASIPGRLGFGWLGDRFDNRWIMAGGFALMSLSLVCFQYASALLVPFIILFGISYGGNFTIVAVLLRGYVGESKFATIYGFLFGLGAIVGVIGPLLAGWVFDNQGSYQGIWLAFAGLAVAGLIAVATIRETPARI